MPISMTKMSRFALMVLVLALALWGMVATAGCDAKAVTETVVRVLVGQEGGTVLGPKGTKIIFPVGAVEDDWIISVQELPCEQVPGNGDLRMLSVALLIQPEGLIFKRPVTVEMPYTRGTLTLAQQKNQITPYIAPVFSPYWMAADGAVQINSHTIRVDTTHFGVFGLFFDPTPEPDGDSDVEEEVNIDDCSCTDWLGEWCPESSGCDGLTAITLDAPEGSGCAFPMRLIDENGDIRLEWLIENCTDPDSISLVVDEGVECILQYSEERNTLDLDCPSCAESYGQAYCGSAADGDYDAESETP